MEIIKAPAPLRFTMIGNPDVDEGKPSVCAIDPTMILFVMRGRTGWHKENSFDPTIGQHREFYPRKNCTVIWTKTRDTLSVMEEPEVVISAWTKAMRGETA